MKTTIENILLLVAGLIVIITSACCFNSHNGFYATVGVIAILSFAAFILYIIKSRKAKLIAEQQAKSERDAERKAYDEQIARLREERDEAEKKAYEASTKADDAKPKQTKAKAKK